MRAMLLRLSIRDFAVVAEAELAFGAGLTVISGETGAGKSLLVDALGFVRGARADSGMVRHGAARAELSAEFDLADAAAARSWLQDNELDDGDACLLRRTLRADGGSRARINGRAATVAQLAELAPLLVAIHGQHAQQALLERPQQLSLLDAYGGHGPALAAVAQAAAAWSALLQERDLLQADAGAGDERRDWLQHQFDELDAQVLQPEALRELEHLHRRQSHAGSLIEAIDAAIAGLGDDQGPGVRLHGLRAALARERTHEPRLGEADAMLEVAAIQLEEATTLLERIRADLDIDPQALADAESRLGRLHDLARKHRMPMEALAAHRDALAAQLQALADAQARLERLQPELDAAGMRWREAAAELSAQRMQAGRRLAAELAAAVGELGMPGARVEVALEPVQPPRPDPLGAERVELLVSANPGQPPAPLRRIASGGELSRLSLALEAAAQAAGEVPTLVFDEVDAGIGGAVAAAVGARLQALGRARQVLCVTHQPQVAAAGDAHWRVRKLSDDGLTQSSVQALDPPARIDEIARMLGGATVSDEARAAAATLLAAAHGG